MGRPNPFKTTRGPKVAIISKNQNLPQAELFTTMQDGRLAHIIERAYTDPRLQQYLTRLQPSDLRADLLHHCITEAYRMAEKYPGKLEKLHLSNKMFAFMYGMVRTQLMSNKSTFYTRYRRYTQDLDAAPELIDEPGEPEEDPTTILATLTEDQRAIFERKKDKTKGPLTPDERQAFQRLKNILPHKRSLQQGKPPKHLARFKVEVDLILPDAADTDSITDAGELLKALLSRTIEGVNLTTKGTGYIAGINDPRLVTTNIM